MEIHSNSPKLYYGFNSNFTQAGVSRKYVLQPNQIIFNGDNIR